MNLPNKITLFRVIIIPVFLVLMLCPNIPNGQIFAAFVFTVASCSDFIDGYLARKYNLVTNFGKFMDPLADKLLVCSALVCFVEYSLVPAWMVIVIIAREFIISGFRLVASDNGLVLAASYWGKFKTATQMILCVLLIVNLDHPVINVIEQVFLWVALILTIISLLDYLIKNRGVILDGKM
jgi:CDP-diacylglycerol--glycerol-3-phosphate 3-phosphatidyltransferase